SADQLPNFEGHLGPGRRVVVETSSARRCGIQHDAIVRSSQAARLSPHQEQSARAVHQYKDKPIERFERIALGCAATQNVQLVPKRDYLSFERTPRPEEVQEDPPEQIEKLEHPAFIARFGRSGQADETCGMDR